MLSWVTYLGLGFSACIAATLLPMQSEAALVALLALEPSAVYSLVLVASIGNVLGSQINWWLGTQLHRWQTRRWFPVKPAQLERAQKWYQQYGRWEPFWRFTVLVTIAKAGRYGVLAYVTLYFVNT